MKKVTFSSCLKPRVSHLWHPGASTVEHSPVRAFNCRASSVINPEKHINKKRE